MKNVFNIFKNISILFPYFLIITLYFLLVNIEAGKEERLIKDKKQVSESDLFFKESINNQSKSNGRKNITKKIIIPVVPFKQ